MLCARCGAANAEAAPYCENCGTPLQRSSGNLTTRNASGPFAAGNSTARPIEQWPTVHMPGMFESSLFAPVPHSPFSQEPLPESLQNRLTLTPGNIAALPPMERSATPPEHSASSGTLAPSATDIADHPTETQVPVPNTPQFLSPNDLSFYAQDMDQAPVLPPQAEPASLPIQPHSALPPWQSEMVAPPLLPGNSWPGDEYQAWAQEEDFAPLFQGQPGTQVAGNLYSGPLNHTPVTSGPLDQYGNMRTTKQLADKEISRLIQPLPRKIMLAGIGGGALLLIGLVFLNPDWATGATIAGLLALILAILLIVAAGVRVALGMLKESNQQRRAQVLSTALLILLLVLFSSIGLSQQNGLHMMQGHYLEGHQNWQAAIAEYQAAGETSSSAVDVARSYNEWGEAQHQQQQYGGAVTSFNMVIQHYQRVVDQLARARSGIVAAYLAWADQATWQQNYAGAVAHYNALLALPFCAASCRSQGLSGDATAYASLGEQQLAARQFAQAVNSFQTLTSRFPAAPAAGKIHADYAQALWGLGQQQLTTVCSDAVGTYRLLAKSFADTSLGKQAASALHQPVPVKGHFTTSIPGTPFQPTAFLVQGLSAGIKQYQFPPLLEKAPTAPIQSDGTFTFSSVPQGTYELVWSSDATLHFYYATNGQQVLYTAHLGPLCTFNYGDINQAIPTTAG